MQGDQPTSKPLRSPISHFCTLPYSSSPCQPQVLTAQRMGVTGGDTGFASLSFALWSRELRCCRKRGSSEVMVTIPRRAFPVSCLASHISFISLVSSRSGPCSVVADTEGIVCLGSHSIRHSLPLQEEATGRKPEDFLSAPSSCPANSSTSWSCPQLFCRFLGSLLHPLFSQ